MSVRPSVSKILLLYRNDFVYRETFIPPGWVIILELNVESRNSVSNPQRGHKITKEKFAFLDNVAGYLGNGTR